MDISQDNTSEVVELAEHWPLIVPIEGFEWVEGIEFANPAFSPTGRFLVARPGPTKKVPSFAEDLYVDFANLRATPKEIVKFANRNGGLRHIGRHFHRADSLDPAMGECWDRDWTLELTVFQQAIELWYRVREGDARWIRKFCDQLYRSFDQDSDADWSLAVPLTLPQNPLALAREIVVATINQKLSPEIRYQAECAKPGCSFRRRGHLGSSTRGRLRAADNGTVDLVILSNDLITTVWLQFATGVSGRRRVKKCEAPDCGAYMDVTDSPRPGARRMHKHCEERLKKRRYRENKRKGDLE